MRRGRGRRETGGNAGAVVTPVTIFGPAFGMWIERNRGIVMGTPPAVATMTDQSGAGNSPTQGVAASRPTQAAAGDLIEFDGIQQFLSAPDAASLDVGTAFTLGARMRLDSLAAFMVIASKGAAGADNAWSVQTDNTGQIRCFIEGIATSLSVAIGDTAIHTWVWRYEGAGSPRLQVWKDGVSAGTNNTVATSITVGATQPVAVGRWAGSAFQFMDGGLASLVYVPGVAATTAQRVALEGYLNAT